MGILRSLVIGSLITGVFLLLFREIGFMIPEIYFNSIGEDKPKKEKVGLQESLILVLFWPIIFIYALVTGKFKKK